MLSDFVTAHRSEIIARCRKLVAARMAPRPTAHEIEQGIPLFLDQLAAALRSKLALRTEINVTATSHGSELLSQGFTVAQVVHDYGDVCQTITQMAIERAKVITTEEFRELNLCLDEAIAGAVTEYGRQREVDLTTEGNDRATENLGVLAHELRNVLGAATLAFDALRTGTVGIGGSTGALLGRSLTRLRNLIDRSLAIVRLDAEIGAPEPIAISELVEEVEVSALMEAKLRGHQLTVETRDGGAVIAADRQILASVIANLVQNALKYTHPHSHVTLRTSASTDRVRIEVEDQCGGLAPGSAEAMFEPFVQGAKDRSGLGLGLSICVRGVAAMGGTIGVRDLPGAGCVFTVELPRGAAASAA